MTSNNRAQQINITDSKEFKAMKHTGIQMALLGKKEDKHHRSAETVYDRVPGGQAEIYGSHLKGRMTSESSIWQ